MLEFANTTPANDKKMKEETYAKEQDVQAPPVHTHTKKKIKVWNSSKRIA